MGKQHSPVFRISAAVVKQLGEELVSDELTAIMELVKNSYDADADWVKITINTTDSLIDKDLHFQSQHGYIVIEDNGTGMDDIDILDKWLFISVSHKREMKRNGEITTKLRTPLGDKGLGRLSTQRLGNILEMFTGKVNETKQHHVAFDWRDFTETSSLEAVNTNYENLPKTPAKKGTRLVITDLKDPHKWSGEDGNKFRGQLSKLIFPFKENRPFNIYLNIDGQDNDLDEINEKLRKFAISRYQFNFDGTQLKLQGRLKLAKLQGSNNNAKKELFHQLIQKDHGKNFFDFLTNKKSNKKNAVTEITYTGIKGEFFNFERIFKVPEDVTLENLNSALLEYPVQANPGAFLGEIDEFNLGGTEEIDSAFNKLSDYKNLVKNQVGVRVFRDGFGIKPYGMEDNDWLKLSKSQTSGGSFYLLRPENVIGFVSITAKENRNLTEKTDREGFIDSAYSRNFFKIIDLAVAEINSVLERTRRSYDDFQKIQAAAKGKIITFADTKKRLVETAKQSNAVEQQAQQVFTEIKAASVEVAQAVERIKSQPLFSTDDDNQALKTLESVERLLNNANQIFGKISNILNNAKQLENDANYLEPRLNELENQIIQFSELAGLGITAEAFTHELYNVIDRIGAQTDQVIKRVKSEHGNNPTFFVYAEHVKSFIQAIRRQLNHLAPSLRFNRETKQEIKLSSFAGELKEYYETRSGGKIEIIQIITNDFKIDINKGKLTQITDNLILNSEYWLTERHKSEPSFQPEITIEINEPFMSIYDNGYGISPVVESGLFQPFVTTKPKGIGRGLGLYIVEQLLDSVGGSISLLHKKNAEERRYIFQIDLEPLLIK
ncbi:ATP-binding protein [Mucilaginibacter sp.]|uniref:ATP-binding protein n=1 Tax=Mucilaginibacter sp. TaxID=1882438 RepID=UPI003D0CFF5E